jgi:hypothetical protein
MGDIAPSPSPRLTTAPGDLVAQGVAAEPIDAFEIIPVPRDGCRVVSTRRPPRI